MRSMLLDLFIGFVYYCTLVYILIHTEGYFMCVCLYAHEILYMVTHMSLVCVCHTTAYGELVFSFYLCLFLLKLFNTYLYTHIWPQKILENVSLMQNINSKRNNRTCINCICYSFIKLYILIYINEIIFLFVMEMIAFQFFYLFIFSFY